jgi:hypothetical protein
MWVNAYQIEYHISQKELKEYAAFCYFKYLFKNGCIYDYNSIKLATKCKYSPAFIRKNIKKFLDKGWCRMHSGNLIFNKSSHFNGQSKNINLYDEIKTKKASIKDILDLFHLEVLKISNSNLDKVKKLKSELKSNKTRTRHKAEDYADSIGFKTEAQRAKLPDETTKLKLSNTRLSKLFGCSSGKASGIIKRLEYLGLIKVDRKIVHKTIGVHTKNFNANQMKSYNASYWSGYHVFIVQPLEFTIL